MDPQPAGFHVTGWLQGITEAEMMRRSKSAGGELRPMSMYQMGRRGRDAVLFGFAPFDATTTREVVGKLWRALADGRD